MWKLLKNIFAFSDANNPDHSDTTSIHKMVSYNSLNKRKNARINFPHFGGCGPFPRAYYNGVEMIVANVSVGGLLIIDDTEVFGSDIGDVVIIDLVWDDLTTKIRSRVVGANMQRRHLQFVDFNAPAFLRISRLVKPGYVGQRFHKVQDDTGSLQAVELWVGPTGENLSFFSTDIFAELTINGEKLTFKKGSTKVYLKDNSVAPRGIIEEALILVANLPNMTQNTKLLLEIVELYLRRMDSKKTGTNG